MTKTKFRRKGFITAYNSVTTKEVRAETWRQELKQRPGRTVLLGLLCMGLFRLPSYEPRTTCLGVKPPTMGWLLSHQSLGKKMTTNLTYKNKTTAKPQTKTNQTQA